MNRKRYSHLRRKCFCMKKRILFVNNVTGGLYLFRKELIENLISDNEIYILASNTGRIDDLKNIGCKVDCISIDKRGKNIFKDLRLLIDFYLKLKEIKPDLVITYTIKPNIYCGLMARFLKIPYAANITGLGTAFQKDGLLKNITIELYKIALKKANIVFFENEENQQIFINNKIIKEENTYLLAGAGVNLEKFSLLDYPEGKTTKFLFIGRVMKEKGVNELFEVMHRLYTEGIECSLDVLGGLHENYEEIIGQYEKEGWLNYHGFQNDVRPYINNCHCFVLPSWHEGMANTNLESAASGRPVITSNIHGCLEAIEDGVTGFLCEKKNPHSLYDAMKRFCFLSYEERKAMGIYGRKRMEEQFDKRKVIEETIECINKLNW